MTIGYSLPFRLAVLLVWRKTNSDMKPQIEHSWVYRELGDDGQSIRWVVYPMQTRLGIWRGIAILKRSEALLATNIQLYKGRYLKISGLDHELVF